MADKDRAAAAAETAMQRTPGMPAGAKATKDPPPAIPGGGPRDALVIDGHNDQDYVPDSESKGYHTGMVRQPVMAVVDGAGRVVGFEAVDESMFSRNPTIHDLKAAHNKRESSKAFQEGIVDLSAQPSPIPSAEDVAASGGTPRSVREGQDPANAGASGAGHKG